MYCSLNMVQCYRKRLSGPLMDRIDIHRGVARLPFQKLAALDDGERSKDVRQRVEAARAVQEQRFAARGWASS